MEHIARFDMKYRYLTFILLLIVIGQVAVDLYLPSLPHMVKSLNTSDTAIQLSLTGFLMGFSLSQLVYGPLSDHAGRKPTLFIGLSLFLIGSIFCALSPNAICLFLFRLLQGLGIGACSTMSRAISRDKFQGNDLAKVSAYVAIAWGAVPMIAPLIGSYIQAYLGWRYNFILLAMSGVILLFAVKFFLPESAPPCYQNQHISFIKNYHLLIKNTIFVKYILCVMLLYGIFVDFNIAGPFLLQNTYHQSVVAYGWWIVFGACGYMLGSLTSSYLVNIFESETIIKYGLIGLALICIIFFSFQILHLANVYTFVIPMFMILMMIGLVYPHCIAGALSPFPQMAGSASALFGCMVFFGGTLSSIIISHLPENNAIPLSFILLVQSFLLNSIILFFSRWG